MPGSPLSLPEREEIAIALIEDPTTPWARIGRRVGRHPTTIAREVAANGGRSRYRPSLADRRVEGRRCRPRQRRLELPGALRDRVRAQLGLGRSPWRSGPTSWQRGRLNWCASRPSTRRSMPACSASGPPSAFERGGLGEGVARPATRANGITGTGRRQPNWISRRLILRRRKLRWCTPGPTRQPQVSSSGALRA
jgi:hypothetical protein